VTEPASGHWTFRHEALLYAGQDEFVRRTAAFIRDSQAAQEPVLVVVAAEKVELLKDEIGDCAGVRFADMDDVGANPARIIPAWYDFVAGQAVPGKRFRGIGEPINAERSPEALTECQRHESLLNLAFADAAAWWLLCPYDTTALDATVIDEALASHPWVLTGGESNQSTTYRELDAVAAPFDKPLSYAPLDAQTLVFGAAQLDHVRSFVAALAFDAGLSSRRVADLVLATNEVATNSLRHGGGSGILRLWREGPSLICEISDTGTFNVPLAGRRRPTAGQEGGFGVWLVHQLCDLVQMRTFQEGSVVRLHMSIA
jgi:anti-sigma regulatory factor (Ser/Thr protein kinase)